MDCYGEDIVNDYNIMVLDDVLVGETHVEHNKVKNFFAPSLIKKLSEDKKLSLPSYKKMYSGFRIRTDFKKDNLNSASINCTPDIRVLNMYPEKSNDSFWNDYAKKYECENKTSTVSLSRTSTASNRQRAASRRTASGFKRYIKQTDSCLTERYQALLSDDILE